eukprot:373282-Rhodomonas_salina.1
MHPRGCWARFGCPVPVTNAAHVGIPGCARAVEPRLRLQLCRSRRRDRDSPASSLGQLLRQHDQPGAQPYACEMRGAGLTSRLLLQGELTSLRTLAMPYVASDVVVPSAAWCQCGLWTSGLGWPQRLKRRYRMILPFSSDTGLAMLALFNAHV